jgi:hypothetical protein
MMSTDQGADFEAAVAGLQSYPDGRYEGRGIVICAGGARLFTCAWVLVGILRRALGCQLPIQLWHLGPEEIGPPMQALMEAQGVEVVDALAVALRHPMRRLGGWEMKPYAIIHSRFREVILIDADNVPAIDPTALFDWPEFAATGALFWPDVVRLRADNAIWELCGIPHRNAPTFESGQVVVDKQRCWQALQLTLFMNEHSDLYYRHVYGDKDTFLMAWLRLGQPFAMTPHPPAFLSEALYQRDFQGRTVFQHRTNSKWTYGGQNPRLPGFQHEEACFALLEELQEAWNGRIFRPPSPSPEARRLAAALEEVRWFDYARIGDRSRRLELLPANRVGEGRGDDAFYWWVEEDADGLVLGLEGRRRTESRLRRRGEGSWSGRSAGPNALEIELQALPANDVSARSAPAASPWGQAPEEACRLLARLVMATERQGGGAEAMRDLTGALRLLAVEQPGFAAAMSERLSAAAARDGPVMQCLATVLAEAAGDGRGDPAKRRGHGIGKLRSSLRKNYDRPQ